MMAHDQIAPQSRRFLAGRREGLPLTLSAWLPYDFYRAIAHTDLYITPIQQRQGTGTVSPAGDAPFTPCQPTSGQTGAKVFVLLPNQCSSHHPQPPQKYQCPKIAPTPTSDPASLEHLILFCLIWVFGMVLMYSLKFSVIAIDKETLDCV